MNVQGTDDRQRIRVVRRADAPSAAVWSVLADGWFYGTWVVGASRVRAVDHEWPRVGTRIHHSFGLWPAVIDDETVVLESVEPTHLAIQAKGWPLGEARAEVDLRDEVGGGCTVTMVEDAERGPGIAVPGLVRQPLIAARNREALRRLALIAEGRHRAWAQAQGSPVS